ncbi:helix-turn-helix domain-containing protein [Maribellus maritimus]|uniref:helix-turn-helix domain-containing protein n=1 Tax=Maribellus maritimus TaxID=2870838 RepID=UPI001EEAF09E|nr:helix-turn-helix domain-containing protein [Maribellus maritimus]MCG6187264.1 helix-turn-helix domain-containing protein [Maribellus maritimus]
MQKTVFIVGFIQSLFGILIFSTKRPRHLSFLFLTIWMAVNAIFLGAGLLPFQVVKYFKPGVFPILILTGPLLYFYVSSLAIENFKLKKTHLLHLVPYLLVCIHRSTISAVSVVSSPDLTQNPNYLYNKIYLSLLLISVFVYWFLSLDVILKHRKKIPLYFSNYSSKNTLSWLIFVLSLFLLFFISNQLLFFARNVLQIGINRFFPLSFNFTLFTFIMIYFGINQSVIYKKDKAQSTEDGQISHSNSQGNKYVGSYLNDQQVAELNDTVINYLTSKKPYLNPEFNLQMMVEDLNISRHKLSQVINRSQNKNFYKLMNEYRIREVKEKLENKEYKNLTVLGIAFECGFNSKTTFNRIFKEETGMTPTNYIKGT